MEGRHSSDWAGAILDFSDARVSFVCCSWSYNGDFILELPKDSLILSKYWQFHCFEVEGKWKLKSQSYLSSSGPGAFILLSPGQHWKINHKVYIKPPGDIDLELEVSFAMPGRRRSREAFQLSPVLDMVILKSHLIQAWLFKKVYLAWFQLVILYRG